MVQLCIQLLVLVNLFFALSVVYGSTVSSIYISGPRIVVEYSKIQLRCITSSKQKDFIWYFSANESETHQKPISSHPSSAIRFHSYGSMLTIRAVDKTHVGGYRCCANDTLICTSINLSVLSATDDSSYLRPTDNFDALLDVQSSGTFALAIFHAPFSGEIYIDREPAVRFCDHFRRHVVECIENRTSDATSYSVQNAAMEQSGPFHIKILFNKRLEKMLLHILIRGEPIVQMDNYSVLSNSSHISLSCRGYAYPTPNITFSYTPCQPTAMDSLTNIRRDACEETLTLPQHLERLSLFNYTTRFEVIIPSWPVQQPGLVSCRASNSEGTSTIETFLFVLNFPTPMQFSVVSPTDVVLYEDTVNITCQADVYNFTNQFTIHHAGSSFNVTGEKLEYAWITTYLTHITNASQNEISCEGHHKNGTLHRNTLNLSIKYPSKPHIVSVNDTVNVTIALGDMVMLECDIDGTPTPHILWFKNDVLLSRVHGHFIRTTLEPEETRATYKCVGKSRLGRATKTWHIVHEDSMLWLLISGLGAGVLLAVLVIGTVAWSVDAYRQLLHRQMELEAHINGSDEV